MRQVSGHYINGQFVEPNSGAYFESTDPYDGDEWIEIPRGNAEDVREAVESARYAVFEGEWSNATASQRGNYLSQIADRVEAKADELIDCEIRDTGRPKNEISGAIRALPAWYRYYAGLANKIQGETIPNDGTAEVYTRKEPVGVVGAITPWNASTMLATWKLAPAIAAGASVVLKPDERASAAVLTLASAIDETGLPNGAVNVVTGFGEEIGSPLVTHDSVDKVSFTGGPKTGATIAEQAGRNLKPTVMELGGKSPNIVFGDANLNNAAEGVIDGIFNAAGQFCAAGSRVLVQDEIHDEFVDELVNKADGLVLGNPRDEVTDMGPLASQAQFTQIDQYVTKAQEAGARLEYGGGPPETTLASDLFYEPTILSDVDPDSTLAQEEVFGPVLAVIKFSTESEAVRIANQTDFGLVAGIWTGDAQRGPRLSTKIRAGTVWINTYRMIGPQYPWGGVKHSGWGRENGKSAVDEFLETKTVFMEYGETGAE
ncbi:aldehyde dehydrogenase [Haloarchaeobius salinus]|uniref:aldehyde dehydrogenase n=1 Tax=Haloarchaeobius salinus TaxID=1198298 RepID=UPI00210BB2B5|nr:aldehyde dehydrogenase [Haloarchaeobius salinus]